MTGARSPVSTPPRRRSVLLKRHLVRILLFFTPSLVPPTYSYPYLPPQSSKGRMQVLSLARCATRSSTIGHETSPPTSDASYHLGPCYYLYLRSCRASSLQYLYFCTLHLPTFASKQKNTIISNPASDKKNNYTYTPLTEASRPFAQALK